VRLQKRDLKLGQDPDLTWQTIATNRLTQALANLGEWEGKINLNEPLFPNTFRLLFCEREWYRSDFEVEDAQEELQGAGRIVYAESILLG